MRGPVQMLNRGAVTGESGQARRTWNAIQPFEFCRADLVCTLRALLDSAGVELGMPCNGVGSALRDPASPQAHIPSYKSHHLLTEGVCIACLGGAEWASFQRHMDLNTRAATAAPRFSVIIRKR